jgi:DNA-binding transcriptional ArsR family regulator
MADRLDEIFEALSHPKRRGIVHTLAFRPATTSQLAEEYELSLPAIHKHLAILERAQLITRRKAGRVNFVALNPVALEAVQTWAAQYQTAWNSSKQTLENYIASLQNGHKPQGRNVR